MILDLSDARRDKKPWLPADDRDVTNGLVIEDEHGKPACARHGAMNRVDPHRLIYRCSEMRCGVGAELAGQPDKNASDRTGLAGCGSRRGDEAPIGDSQSLTSPAGAVA